MTLELRFFANFREAVGQKVLERSYDGPSVPIGDVLADLEAEYPDLDFFDDDGELREYLSILKNGQNVVHLDGLETPVGAEDRISIFPPVAGG
ncbi:MAG: ubiquitin-like small modifier protein 1 [Halobacteriales archaeon]